MSKWKEIAEAELARRAQEELERKQAQELRVQQEAQARQLQLEKRLKALGSFVDLGVLAKLAEINQDIFDGLAKVAVTEEQPTWEKAALLYLLAFSPALPDRIRQLAHVIKRSKPYAVSEYYEYSDGENSSSGYENHYYQDEVHQVDGFEAVESETVRLGVNFSSGTGNSIFIYGPSSHKGWGKKTVVKPGLETSIEAHGGLAIYYPLEYFDREAIEGLVDGRLGDFCATVLPDVRAQIEKASETPSRLDYLRRTKMGATFPHRLDLGLTSYDAQPVIK